MGKATYLADLYQKSVEILTQNRTEWMGLLSSVSKYYKLSFDKNVLIYVQRPDAGLLATKMGWEKQTGRYLKAGCKGIGVVDMDNPKATLTYYFDLADTRGSYDGFRAAMNAVWELERQYQPEIMHRFHIQFRTDTTSIENCLCQLVQMQGKAYMAKYNPKLEVKDENSVLYGLPEKAVQEEFARLVSDSAAYIVFRKCGIQPDVFEETGAFQNISHFNSTEMFMALGYHATAIAKPVLMEINRQIEEIKEERSRRYEQRTISEDGLDQQIQKFHRETYHRVIEGMEKELHLVRHRQQKLESERIDQYTAYLERRADITTFELFRAGYAEKRARLDKQEADLIEQMESLKKLEQVQVRMVREFLCFKKQILSSRKKAYQLLTTELIHTFVKQIFVYQDKRVEIIFKFEDEMQYLMGKIASLCEGRASA